MWRWEGNTIVSKLGYALHVEGGFKDSLDQEQGSRVIAWEPNGEIHQQWMMIGDRIISGLNGMALDIEEGWLETNVNIIIWYLKIEDYENQSWELEYI